MQLDDIDMEKRKILLRNFQDGVTYIKAKENIIAKFGNCVGFGDRTCQRWFTKFRRGDFNLLKKPRDKPSRPNRDYNFKKRPSKKKTVKVSEVTFKQPEMSAPPINVEQNATLQNLIKSKPQLTICKVPANSVSSVKKPPLESNKITKRLITSPTRPILFPSVDSPKSPKEMNPVPLEMPKLRPRRPRSKGIEIQLPVNAAKRMNPQTLTENHSIREGSKGSPRKATAKNTFTEYPGSREVSVQFQNLNPEVARNTVRKTTKTVDNRHTPLQLKPQNSMLKIANVAHVESLSPKKNKTTDQPIAEVVPNKRDTLPQGSPLTNQKGIIYLNPQEIFRQSFGGFESSLKRPNPYMKTAHQIYKHSNPIEQPHPDLPPPPPPTERQNSVVLCDSDDSGEDILFPENIRLPAPKIKNDATYTTYFDMESGKQIHLNSVEPILPNPAIPVIEID